MPSPTAPRPLPTSGVITSTEAGSSHQASAGIYVHWPFCLSKCPYCDFNSHVRAAVADDDWRVALCAEVDRALADLGPGPIGSVFFGGGTPSLMPPATVAAILDRIAASGRLDADAEITLEANPTSVEAARFAGFRAAGVNRVSIGVQALEAEALAFLGRGHDVDQALGAIALARRIFPRVSFDLIYARPGQGVAAWTAELGRALDLGPDHLSLYQLTIEEGTAFHRLARQGTLVIPDQDLAADLWDATQVHMAAAGLPAYEVSNHAAPGQECRHNLVYWRYRPYAGIGPGAHGRIHRDGEVIATQAFRKPETWLDAVRSKGDGTEVREPVAPADRVVEALMMGLRLSEGIDAGWFEAATGTALYDAVPPARLTRMIDGGLILADAVRLRVTPTGRQVLNAILADLID